MAVSCPHCRQVLADDPSLAGQVVACPYCGGRMTMPEPDVPPVQIDTSPRHHVRKAQAAWKKADWPRRIKYLMAIVTIPWALLLAYNLQQSFVYFGPSIGEILAPFVISAVCPTVAWGLVMAGLGVAYFVAKE